MTSSHDHSDEMETLHQAIRRLEEIGFTLAFRATTGGDLEARGVDPIAPETLVLEETVRFEGASDPEDEAVLFALRSRDGALKGTFVASYGTQVDPSSAAAIERLSAEVDPGSPAAHARSAQAR